MAMHPNPDRDTKYMKDTWGTTRLVTDYASLSRKKKKVYHVDYCEYFEDSSK